MKATAVTPLAGDSTTFFNAYIAPVAAALFTVASLIYTTLKKKSVACSAIFYDRDPTDAETNTFVQMWEGDVGVDDLVALEDGAIKLFELNGVKSAETGSQVRFGTPDANPAVIKGAVEDAISGLTPLASINASVQQEVQDILNGIIMPSIGSIGLKTALERVIDAVPYLRQSLPGGGERIVVTVSQQSDTGNIIAWALSEIQFADLQAAIANPFFEANMSAPELAVTSTGAVRLFGE